jgi:hypothetical protein
VESYSKHRGGRLADTTKVFEAAGCGCIHNEKLHGQFKRATSDFRGGEEAKVGRGVQHRLDERTKLQEILSDFTQGRITEHLTDC